jgi:hypothetical protein
MDGGLMTFRPAEDLAKHVRFIAEFDDGSKDVFAVAQSTLDQGGPRGDYIARIVAGHWQRDGYIKPGKIVRVYRDPALLYV